MLHIHVILYEGKNERIRIYSFIGFYYQIEHKIKTQPVPF